MMSGRGFLLLQRALEGTAEENRPSVQRNSVQEDAENKAVAAERTPAVEPTADEALDEEVADAELSDYSADEYFVDDSDTDPTYFVPVKKISQPLVFPKKFSSSSSSSSSPSSSGSSSASDDEFNRPGPSTANTQEHSTSSLTNEPSTSAIDSTPSVIEPKLSKKRKQNPAGWKSNIAKALRNEGKSYVSLTNPNKIIAERQIHPPCGEKCRLRCQTKIDSIGRKTIFEQFWQLGDLERQREYIVRHTQEIKPKYRYITSQKLRALNSAYYFEKDNNRIRVCKLFFKATLGICDRFIKTAISKKTDDGFIKSDARGKHANHRKIDSEIRESVTEFINSIPRIESHYLRAQTSRQFISSDKCLADLYRDYKTLREQNNLTPASASTFSRIFNEDFNISFYIPKKDLCDLCESFKNADDEGKAKLRDDYNNHLKEKELSRLEKEADKNRNDVIVAVYDLQAVMQVPKGQVSLFFYKSRINCFNFTVSDLKAKDVVCFFWDETEAKRGAVEIGSCVLKYVEMALEKSVSDTDVDIIFYSDNCCGQQKNKYLLSVYAYAVNKLRVNSITHKFLIRGHSQNEGDNIHSVIEKQIKRHLRSGPIYCPQQYATLIRTAKKTGMPYILKELTYDDFYDLKILQETWGNNFNIDEDNNQVKWHDIKQLRVEKKHPLAFFYKTSFGDNDFKKVCVRNRSRRYKDEDFSPVLPKAYSEKQPLAVNKKKDIMELIEKNIIPSNYVTSFYKTALGLQ